MATLTIKDKQIEAKCSFAYDRVAEEKYKTIDEKGNQITGFMSIYLGLLGFENQKLVAFWDCALAHLDKRPSINEIEKAIDARIEADGDTEKLFKEAYKAMDESGFYKKQVKKLWENFDNLKTAGSTKEEKEKFQQMHKVLTDGKKELSESTTTN